jgi:hypothetical protein
MIDVELILASKNAVTGDILFTFKQTFPRWILAESNTHTIAAKSSASSRAIPTPRQLRNVLNDPFHPISVGQYQSGMQAGSEITGWKRILIDQTFSKLRYINAAAAYFVYKLGAAKQISNRLVENWMTVEQLWTSTDVENEMLLRDHWKAEPHYEAMAKKKHEIIRQVKAHFAGEHNPALVRTCQVLNVGEWHLPYLNWADYLIQLDDLTSRGDIRFKSNGVSFWNAKKENYDFIPGITNEDELARAVSAGRCAWVSYYMPGDDSKKMNNLLAALSTYQSLAGDNPKHLSPLMHVATPLPLSVRVGSHCGWLMYRKYLPSESGGDKVVPSITPKAAFELLDWWDETKTLDLVARETADLVYEDLIETYEGVAHDQEEAKVA